MQLAQANIALFHWPLDDERMAEFAAQIDAVYQVAESSVGYQWRHLEAWQPLALGEPWSNARLFFNMSVWTDISSLQDFLQSPAHTQVMSRRAEWTESVEGRQQVMWWVEAGQWPSVEDAIAAFARLNQEDDSAACFSFSKMFDERGNRV